MFAKYLMHKILLIPGLCCAGLPRPVPCLFRDIELLRGGNLGSTFSPDVYSSLLAVLFILLQALGQCGQFIQSHLKDAVLVKTPSTVAAVEALLSDEEEGRSSAAIASGVCERLFDGVQVLFKGVQDEACESGFLYIRVSRSFS